MTTNQSDIKSSPNPNLNPNCTIKQHAVVSIQLNIVTCLTYPEKFVEIYTRHCYCTMLLLSVE